MMLRIPTGSRSKKKYTVRQSIIPLETRREVDGLTDELFRLADSRHAGSVRFGDFMALHDKLIATAVSLPKADHHEIEGNFRRLDRDHNGTLDKEEFAAYMESLLAVLGNRTFKSTLKDVIEKEKVQRATFGNQYDLRYSERLLEQARIANYFMTEMQQIAYGFLNKKANPNHVDESGSHALFYAANKSNASFVARLMECRADPMLHNKAMESAVFMAARVRSLDNLATMVLPDPREFLDAEQMECEKASQELIREMYSLTEVGIHRLLAKRADINFKDQSGWTPLTTAVFFGRADALEALLKTMKAPRGKKLRINGWNGAGRGPLHIAARKGHAELVGPLMRARGDPDSKDADGWTPLHHAAFNGRDEVIAALLEWSADMHIQQRNGLSVFQVTRLPSSAGSLTETTIEMLRPSHEVDFGKKLLPVLKDEKLTPYDRLQSLLALQGVGQQLKNLRLHDQFFDPRSGPNKVRLRKVWELLAMPMIRRLRDGATDLPHPGNGHTVDESNSDRMMEITVRQKEQKAFILEWLRASKGLQPEANWKHENRMDYGSDLRAVLDDELSCFRKELDRLYEATKAMDGGSELVALKSKEVILPQCRTQLAAHPIPYWVEQLNPAGALEALRVIGACTMGKDDTDALLAFMDLVNIGHEFNTGRKLWRNIYRLWLSEYAKVVNAEFHQAVKAVVERFSTLYASEGLSAVYQSAPIKTYERMKIKEREFGQNTHESYEGRTMAAHILDVVRGSITASSPRAALVLLEDFFRPLEESRGRLKLARVVNRFNPCARAPFGYRNLELSLLFDGGMVPAKCGRPGLSLAVSLVCEVQINLESFLEVKKRMDLITKCYRGDFDWDPEDYPAEGDELEGVLDDPPAPNQRG